MDSFIGKFVVVTTDSSRRGVFGGVLVERHGDTVVLEAAQNAVYWSEDVHGVFGLAVTGPSSDCRIGPAVLRLELNGVTSISLATDAAREAWRACPWKS